MKSLDIEIGEIKRYINTKDINYIKKLYLSPIRKNQMHLLKTEDIPFIEEYNYYAKLLKTLKKHIRLNPNKHIILNILEDKIKNVVLLLISIDLESLGIGKEVDIRIITGNNNRVYMDCTYYEYKDKSSLYINNFRAVKAKNGYGTLLLSNIKDIAMSINQVLINNNLSAIVVIEGLLVADENIINEEYLRILYKKYGFEIDNQNNLSLYIANI